MKKVFVSPEELRRDSFKLAAQIVKSEFKPDFIICLWRGGAPIGMYIHEFLKYKGIKCELKIVRTSKYIGIGECNEYVKVDIRDSLDVLNANSKVLIVDDIFETGCSIEAVLNNMHYITTDSINLQYPKDIKIATIHYKSEKRVTHFAPDYYVTETDSWIVYPNELEGLTLEEIKEGMGNEISELL